MALPKTLVNVEPLLMQKKRKKSFPGDEQLLETKSNKHIYLIKLNSVFLNNLVDFKMKY